MNIHVTDALAPACTRTSTQIPAFPSMAPGAAVTYTCMRPGVLASFTNIATATGTPPAGPDISASDSAAVKVQALTPPTPARPRIAIAIKPKVQRINKHQAAKFKITVTTPER